jgi:hypothetical protein
MPEYEGSRLIQIPPSEVFSFVADVRNLQGYVPTVRSAEPLPNGRVRVAGVKGQTQYVDDGSLKIDEDRRRVEWQADERNYRGWLEVGDEDGLARIFVHLSFSPEKIPEADPLVPDEPLREDKPVLGRNADDDPISVSLDAALRSLHDILEGRGGKRVTPGEPYAESAANQ